MKDGFNRNIDYLRISLTDKCNLRCKYCMPQGGIKHLDHSEIISLEEVAYTVKVMAKLGVRRVRLTGGEPLVRKNITKLISDIKKIDGIERISLTTNGVLLGDNIDKLKEAGLSDVNISLDTLDREVFKNLTGVDGLNKVLKSIDLAIEKGLTPKINCVPILGWNDSELVKMAELARDKNLDVRFIELMPTSCGKNFKGIPSDLILEKLELALGEAEKCQKSSLSGPADYYIFNGFKGRVGFISPLSHIFCENCNRVRLTAIGGLKLCLHQDVMINLKDIIRSGNEEQLKDAILEGLSMKPQMHNMNKKDADTNMFQIGG